MKASTYAILIFICFVSISSGTDSDVMISWGAPLLNANGTKCVDYAGVKVFQRIDDEAYNFNTPIAVVYTKLYWVKSDFYKDGVYHWVLQSFDISNNICPDYTEEVSKTIKLTTPDIPRGLTFH